MFSFDLTPLQEAYWVGEQGVASLSNRALGYHAIHFYLEWNENEFKRAFRNCIEKFPILNGTITRDGRLLVAENADILHFDVFSSPLAAAWIDGENIAQKLFATFPNLDEQLFKLLIIYDDNGFTIHYVASLILLDSLSGNLFISTLIDCYQNKDISQMKVHRLEDYHALLNERKNYKLSSQYELDLAFWKEQVKHFPDPINFPVNTINSKEPYKTQRLTFSLDNSIWLRIQKHCQIYRITPTMCLLSAFVRVLSRYANARHLLLGLMFLNRGGGNVDNEIMGNLGDIILCDFEVDPKNSFAEFTSINQKKFFRSYEHRQLSGIEVSRMYNSAKNFGNQFRSVPIVFSSTLGVKKKKQDSLFVGNYLDGSIQSPGIWLDLQVVEDDHGLRIFWDYVLDYFPYEFIESIFASFKEYLFSLSIKDTWASSSFCSILSHQSTERQRFNLTDKYTEPCFLDDSLLRYAQKKPDAPYVLSAQKTFTYRQVSNYANNIAYKLNKFGIVTNDIIAILLPKSIDQVVAVYGVLISGAAYLPLDADLPEEQVKLILQQVNCKLVISNDELFNHYSLENERYLPLSSVDENACLPNFIKPDRALSDLAYVIFTSGSTGIPKGVMISHKAAVNTVIDINDRFSIQSADRVLSCSALHFDLSVYDIFGMAFVGGSLVIPCHTNQRDVMHWCNLILIHQVTVWNTVPALFLLLVEAASGGNEEVVKQLSIVLLSGDWIPIDLPEKARELNPSLNIIGLGGATEASIWSNFYKIEKRVDSNWSSIPYGYPLSNQRLMVLDEALNLLPDWVVGDLYIGGTGVAKGYINDSNRTLASFIEIPWTSGIWYRTGDKALHRPSGIVEFIGREDGQIKINGYRVELGEIESYLSKATGLNLVTVRYFKDKRKKNHLKILVAFITEVEQAINIDDLTMRLKKWLPVYKIPTIYIPIDTIPLTQNGKIDNIKLEALFDEYVFHKINSSQTAQICFTKTEKIVQKIWHDLLGVLVESPDASFMEYGGSSLLFIRMIMRIREHFSLNIDYSQAINYYTIKALSNFIVSKIPSTDQRIYIPCHKNGSKKPFFCIHPIGGGVMNYFRLMKGWDLERPFYAAQRVQALKTRASTIESLASQYVSELRNIQPQGPYLLGGWSFGGVVAFEMARQLLEGGELVENLIMFDSYLPSDYANINPNTGCRMDLMLKYASDIAAQHGKQLILHEYVNPYSEQELFNDFVNQGLFPNSLGYQVFKSLFEIYQENRSIYFNYLAKPLAVNAVMFRAKKLLPGAVEPDKSWEELFNKGKYRVIYVEADHYTMFDSPNVNLLAETTCYILG